MTLIPAAGSSLAAGLWYRTAKDRRLQLLNTLSTASATGTIASI